MSYENSVIKLLLKKNPTMKDIKKLGIIYKTNLLKSAKKWKKLSTVLKCKA